MDTLIITLQFLRSTKNKHLYTNDADTALGSVYIEKAALPDPPPAEIVITVEENQ